MLDMHTMGISRLAGLQNHCVPTASCNERALGHWHRAFQFLKKVPKSAKNCKHKAIASPILLATSGFELLSNDLSTFCPNLAWKCKLIDSAKFYPQNNSHKEWQTKQLEEKTPQF